MLASQRAFIKVTYKRGDLESQGLQTLRTKLDLTYLKLVPRSKHSQTVNAVQENTRHNHKYNLNELLRTVSSFNYQISFQQKLIKAQKSRGATFTLASLVLSEYMLKYKKTLI